MPNPHPTQITEGMYLVDKPIGSTSHDVVNYFRKQSNIKRIGHCGTLDPLASGLLIILVGRNFTKSQDLYLKQDKEYLVEASLGKSTDTYDGTGTVVDEVAWSFLEGIDQEKLSQVLEHFHGLISQKVPAFSAVKVSGQKLYKKAHLGKKSILPTREVEIKKLELLEFKKDVKKEEISFQLRVECSSGTYIRSLIHDLGQALGCGAYVKALRRVMIGDFHVKNAMQIELQARRNFKKDLDSQI